MPISEFSADFFPGPFGPSLPMPASEDEYFMGRCLQLAQRGWGHVAPNPLVGAVVLDANGQVVGEGYHGQYGGPHAEPVALDQAGDRARGGTLYVNLEPCNHHGKTPPCTERVLASGVYRVVCGSLDPNPHVEGRGRDVLQNHQISVCAGVLEPQCLALNAPFFYAMTRKKPHVTLKLAVTLDGKIATRNGQSQWVTGSIAREWVHHQRAGVQGLLTTATTVMADDPQLTVRHWAPAYATCRPIRIVLDRTFKLNPRLFKVFNMADAPTMVVTSPRTHRHPHRIEAEAMGVQVLEAPETSQGLDLSAVFSALYGQKLYSLWVESGGQLAGALLEGGWVQRIHWVMAGKLLPDPQSRGALVGSLPQWSMADARRLTLAPPVPLGEDWLVTAAC